MPPSKNISFDELSKYFHLPINQVAKELGVCATILKKICRRNGIPRWPHRKIKSIDKMIGNLEINLAKNPQEREDIRNEIDLLKTKKMEIMRNPELLGNLEITARKLNSLAKGQGIECGLDSLGKIKMKSSRGPYQIKTFKVKELTLPEVATTASLGAVPTEEVVSATPVERLEPREALPYSPEAPRALYSRPFVVEAPKELSSFRPIGIESFKMEPETKVSIIELPPPMGPIKSSPPPPINFSAPGVDYPQTLPPLESHFFSRQYNLSPMESSSYSLFGPKKSPSKPEAPSSSLPSWFLEERSRLLGSNNN